MRNTSLFSAARPDRHAKWNRDPERSAQGSAGADVEFLAHWLDAVFRIPGLGIRFGLDALLGLIPGIGDTLTSLASLYILSAAGKHGVPRVTIVRMAMNVSIDYVFGAIPLIGDLFDVYWKANVRNAALLRRHLTATSAEQRRATRGDKVFVAVVILGLVALLVASVAMAAFIMIWIGRLLFGAIG